VDADYRERVLGPSDSEARDILRRMDSAREKNETPYSLHHIRSKKNKRKQKTQQQKRSPPCFFPSPSERPRTRNTPLFALVVATTTTDQFKGRFFF